MVHRSVSAPTCLRTIAQTPYTRNPIPYQARAAGEAIAASKVRQARCHEKSLAGLAPRIPGAWTALLEDVHDMKRRLSVAKHGRRRQEKSLSSLSHTVDKKICSRTVIVIIGGYRFMACISALRKSRVLNYLCYSIL